MKLSEAIRLGAMMKPQAFGTWFDGEGTCATGAALDAMGFLGNPEAFPSREIEEVLIAPYLASPQFKRHSAELGGNRKRPCRCNGKDGVGPIMVHLNNRHRWTRERIADWVETIENAQTQTADVPAVEVSHA